MKEKWTQDELRELGRFATNHTTELLLGAIVAIVDGKRLGDDEVAKRQAFAVELFQALGVEPADIAAAKARHEAQN